MEPVSISTYDMELGETYQVGSKTSPFIFRGFVKGERYGDGFKAEYPSATHTISPRPTVFKPIQPKENTMTKLYEITTDGKTVFGTKLAVNSSGDWVMEIKGEGTVMSVPKADVQEVFPYTVEIKFNDNRTPGSQGYNYFATAGDWAVGDLVVPKDSSSIATVTKLDCKSTAATKWLSGMKLQGTYIKSGE